MRTVKYTKEHLLKAISDHKEDTEDVLLEDDYFMAVAFLTSDRSKDPKTQVGACIVNARNRIVGIGYNGMPNGWPDDVAHWGKDNQDKVLEKHTYVCHAELNAIVNKYTEIDLSDCRIYQTRYPCNECAKLIIQAGIQEVYYLYAKGKEDERTARLQLEEAGVRVARYKPKQGKIHLLDGIQDGGSSSTSKETKRKDYLSWERYFMAMAFLISRRSKDSSTKVGSCIVMPDKRIVGLGYNCLLSSDKEFSKINKEKTKYPLVYHAAANAYMTRMTNDVAGASLYTTLLPCNECIKLLIQAGIKKIVYASEEYTPPEPNQDNPFQSRKSGAKKMLNVVGVEYSHYDVTTTKGKEVKIDFEKFMNLHEDNEEDS